MAGLDGYRPLDSLGLAEAVKPTPPPTQEGAPADIPASVLAAAKTGRPYTAQQLPTGETSVQFLDEKPTPPTAAPAPPAPKPPALTWADVSSSSKFQSLDDAGREQVRENYFRDFVAPNVPTDKLDAVRATFDADTKPSLAKSLTNAVKSGVDFVAGAYNNAITSKPDSVIQGNVATGKISKPTAAQYELVQATFGKMAPEKQDLHAKRVLAESSPTPAQLAFLDVYASVRQVNNAPEVLAIKNAAQQVLAKTGPVRPGPTIDAAILRAAEAQAGEVAGAESRVAAIDATPKMKEASLLSDAGNLLGRGAVGTVEAMSELGTRALSVFGIFGQVAAEALNRSTAKTRDVVFNSAKDYYTKDLSTDQVAAGNEKWWDGDRGTFGEAWKNPRSYFGAVVESLPGTVISMGPGMSLARTAYQGALARGATREAASVAAAGAATVAGAFIEGGLGAGQSGAEVRQAIGKLSDDVLMTSDAFQSLLGQGLSKEQAREALASDASATAFLLGGVATGIFGGMGDRFLARAFTSGVTGGIVARVLKGAASEGVFEELPQSYFQKVAENFALRTANPDQELTDDALNQGLGGLAAGAVMGAGFGAVSKEDRSVKPVTTARGKDDETPVEASQVIDSIDAKANEAAPNPTPAQKEAGNYKKGHVTFKGLGISIENPVGSKRSGVDPDGNAWENTMQSHYGYIKGTVGKDKDHIDTFIGPARDSDKVFVIDQKNKDGSFDEHKVMLGFDSLAQAESAYKANYQEGFDGIKAITEATMPEFKAWLQSGNTAKEFKFVDAAMQPRDRNRVASIAQMQSIANNPDFDRLAAAPTPTDGAPVVSVKDDAPTIPDAQRGNRARITFANGMKLPIQYAVVEADSVLASNKADGSRNLSYFQGAEPGAIRALTNGRVAGLQAAYSNKTADGYKAGLVEAAPDFGIDAEVVKAMTSPILIRVYPDSVNREVPNLGELSNAGGGMQMSSVETAEADAGKLAGLEGLAPDENGNFTNAASQGFIKRFVASVSDNDRGKMLAADGSLSATGVQRIRGAILARAYGGGPILDRMLESTDDNIKRITTGLTIAAPRVADMRARMESGDLDSGLNIIPDFIAAVEEFSKLRSEGTSVEQYLAQGDILGRPYSDETIEILAKLSELSKSQRKVAEFLTGYVDEAERIGSPKQGGMFDDLPSVTKKDVLRTVSEKTSGQESQSDTATPQAQDQRAGEQARKEPEAPPTAEKGAGEDDWVTFKDSLGIPRAQMPQIKGNQRPALLAFLSERGIGNENDVVPAKSLKPTQAEYSRSKLSSFVETGVRGTRAVIISSDNYVLDGHHQWLGHAKRAESIPVIRVATPIRNLLKLVNQFPGVRRSEGSDAAEVAMINGHPYTKLDNFKPPKTAEFLPADLIKQADEYVSKYYVNRPPLQISVEERAKAEALLQPLIEKANQDKAAYDQKIIDIAQRTGAIGQMLAPVKGIKRAAEKLVTDEAFDIDGMKDMLRSTIVVSSYADAQAVVTEIEKEFKLLRDPKNRTNDFPLKSRGKDIAPENQRAKDGYTDMLLNVVMPSGVIAEIQINVPEMLAAKEGQGHKLYEAFREAKKDSPLGGEIMGAMRGFYNQAFEAAASRHASADLRNDASSDDKSDSGRGKPLGTSDAPSREIPNTEPSGNTTRSSPPNESKNSQPGGNLSGIGFIENDSLSDTGILPQNWGSTNKLVSQEAAAEARALLRKNLNRMNSGLDPQLAAAAMKLAVFHIEAGARSFAVFSKVMIKELGAAIKPYLKSLYDQANSRDLFADMDTPAVTEKHMAEVIKPTLDQRIVAKKTAPIIQQAGFDFDAPAAENKVQGAPNDSAVSGNGKDAAGRSRAKSDAPTEGDGGARPVRARSGGRAGKPDIVNDDGGGQRQGAGGDGVSPSNDPGRNAVPRDRVREPERIDRGTSRNYRFQPDDLNESGSAFTKAEQNVEALELLKQLEADGRQATPAEQKKLAQFIGWGASEIRNKLFPTGGKYQITDMRWRDLRNRVEEAMTPDEIKDAMRSTQYAHYTSRAVIDSIYAGLNRLGFAGGQILEPGMGIGNFAGLMPQAMANQSFYTGVEMDRITGGIAKQLFPDEHIRVESFVDTKIPRDYYDAAIGNPPFASTKILADPEYKSYAFALHDYFFAKTIDRVKPGGLMVFVTSRYTMDKMDDKARRYLSERANLLGAIRLPQTAFKANAGTEVVTDVLFLQKHGNGVVAGGEQWANLRIVDTKEGPANINEYYKAHPDMVLGVNSLQGSMYSKNEYTVLPHPSKDIETLFAEAVKNLPKNVYRPVVGSPAHQNQTTELDLNPLAEKEGSFYLGEKTRALMVRQNGVGVPVTIGKGGLNSKQAAVVRSYIPLRDALKQAQYDQLNEGDWETSLKALQKEYKKFVGEHGRINQFTVVERVNKDGETEESFRYPLHSAIWADPDNTLVRALEHVDEETQTITESAFLRDRVLKKPAPPKIETVQDALMVTLNNIGKVDIDRVAELANTTRAAAIEVLGNSIYETPQGEFQMADEYLSGSVKEKLAEARAAAATNPKFRANVEALEKAQPPSIAPSDIEIRLGMNWLDVKDIEDFAKEVTGVEVKVTHNEVTNQWGVEGRSGYWTTAATKDWGTDDRPFHKILDAALNKRGVKVTYTDSNNKTHVNEAATEAANAKLQKVRDAFSQWMWKDGARADRVANKYNELFNTEVPRQFNGDHLVLPGLSLKFKPHPHVKRAVWRIIQTGNTYLAHAVGAGKTAEMVISAMEQKRLGLINKPMFAVPNHMLRQFSAEFLELYPAARLMVADEKNFHSDQRRQFVARAALSDLDAVIITHSAFKLLDLDPAFKEQMINRELDIFRSALEDVDKGDRVKRRQIENAIEGLEQKLKAVMSSAGKDKNVRFDEMGVDMLYVDEAHLFRKLAFSTNMTNVKGLDPTGSERAFDLYMKTRWLDEKKPNRSLVLASGTPITNTLAELYTVQRFMAPKALDARGLKDFDAWASMFGVETTSIEADAAGKYGPVTRFAKFINVPELTQMFLQFADVLTSEKLGQLLVNRPKYEGGAPKLMVTERTPELADYQEELKDRMDKIRARSGPPEKGQDIMLNVITDGRLAAIDTRYVRSMMPSNPKSKLNSMIDDVIDTYKATSKNEYMEKDKPSPRKGGVQIIFSDVGFGEGVTKRGFDARAWVMKRFKEGGIPADEVAWMSDVKKSDAKAKLFQQVRSGVKRILIGSTAAMGVGTNVQTRLVAEHNLDAPWYPADLEQRIGRIVRHGNQNKLVTVKNWATKGTYDTVMFQMLATKKTFIDQVLMGNRDIRSVDDVTEADQYTIATAMTAGDERAILLAGLKADLSKLGRLQSAHLDSQHSIRNKILQLEYYLKKAKDELPIAEKQAAQVVDLSGDNFVMTIDGKKIDERKAAGIALITKAMKLAASVTEGSTKLGSISGFDVVFRGHTHKNTKGDLVDYSYDVALDDGTAVPPSGNIRADSDAVGVVTSISNWVAKLGRRPAEMKANIAKYETELVDYRARAGAPFEFAAEYAEKRAQAENLERELMAVSLAAKAPPDDATPVKMKRGAGGSSTVAQVKTWIKPLGTDAIVVQSETDLPESVRSDIRSQNAAGDVRGLFYESSGQNYLIADNIGSEAEAIIVALHEAAHRGLRKMFGKDMAAALDALYWSNKRVADQTKATMKRLNLSRLDAVEEVIADMAYAGTAKKLTGWARFVKAIMDFLRGLGVKVTLTDEQVESIAAGAAKMGLRRGSPADDIAQRFEAETGDSIRVAGAKIAAAEVRNNMRAAGNAPGKPEAGPYTPEQVAMFDQWKAMQSKSSKYLYHTTRDANLESIKKNGLVVGSPQRFEGVGNGRISLAANEATAAYYGSPTDVMLRVKADYQFEDMEEDLLAGGGAYTVGKNIPPEALEVREGKKWVPLKGVSIQKTDIRFSVRPTTTPMRGVLDPIMRVAGGQLIADYITKPIYGKVIALAEKLAPERVKAGLVDNYGLSPIYVARKTDMYVNQAAAAVKTKTFIDELVGLSREQSRVAYLWMTQNQAQGDDLLKLLGEKERDVLVRLKNEIAELGKEALRLGQLSQESFDRNNMAYLHRTYEKHETIDKLDAATRKRAIRILGKQYQGRGLREYAPMESIGNDSWWGMRRTAGKADTDLAGQKFLRFEDRTNDLASGKLIEGENRGKLRAVEYWPADKPVPAKYTNWTPAGTWEARYFNKAGKIGMWRDFTPTELERMGEIDEVKYAVAKTLSAMTHDIEVGRMFEWVARNFAKADPDGLNVVDAKDSLLAAYAVDEWVQVPTTKAGQSDVAAYGKLAGMYLPGPVWNDIRQVNQIRYQPLGETYATILNGWKISKTALSPATHMNNVMSNFVMADMNDIGLADITRAAFTMASSSQEAKGIMARYLVSGAEIGSYAANEIKQDMMAELLKQLRAETDGAGISGPMKVADIVASFFHGQYAQGVAGVADLKLSRITMAGIRKMMDAYQAEDTLFRLAAFIKHTRDGKDDREAGRLARESFLDYNINAPWINSARATFLPFISFTYRALPMLARTAAERPWKLAKYMLVAGGLNAAAYALLGLGGDDEDKERALLPDEKSGKLWGVVPKLIRLPWNGEGNAPMFIDVRRWIPVGDIVDFGQNNAAVPVPPTLFPGGPLWVMAEILANKSSFTGKEITKDTDTTAEKVVKSADYLYKAMMPNLIGLPNVYATEGVFNAAKGKTDVFGREQSVPNALASSIGLKVGAYPKDVLLRNQKLEFDIRDRELQQQQAAKAREFARKGITREELNKELEALKAKRLENAKKLQEKINAAR